MIIIREWQNGIEKGGDPPKATLPEGFKFDGPNDISVRIDGGTVTVAGNNGQNLFSYTIPAAKRSAGVFGLRTWNNNVVNVGSSRVGSN